MPIEPGQIYYDKKLKFHYIILGFFPDGKVDFSDISVSYVATTGLYPHFIEQDELVIPASSLAKLVWKL